jgi:ABC-type sugar transport system permease subunit
MTSVFIGREDSLEGSSRPAVEKHGSIARRDRRWGLLFVSPWLFGLTVLFAFPIVASLVLSFTDYRLVPVAGDESGINFVGLENWRRLFADGEVSNGAWVTAKFAVVYVPLMVVVPLAVAYLLTAKHLWFKRVFRTLFYLPTMVPFIAAVIVWRFFLNSKSGWFSRIFGTIGINTPDFLNDAQWITAALWMISLWGIGNAMILNIAALESVPKDLYEAATLEGAGNWRLFRDITIPMISPIVFYNLVLTLVAVGQYFVVPFALTEGTGDPDKSARFYTMYFYQQTFSYFEAGYGSALAWMMFIVVAALTGLLFWSAKYWVHYEYEDR